MTDRYPTLSIEDFLKIFRWKVTPRALLRIKKAFEFSERCHGTQTRDNGEPYHNHCVATALIICLEWDIWDYEIICAALLHDTIEDKDLVDQELLGIAFSEREARLVDLVSKPKKNDHRFKTPEERHLWYFGRFRSCQEIEALIIKAADRLHNLRTLENCFREKQNRKLIETIDVYLPIFERIREAHPELGSRIISAITEEIGRHELVR